MWYDEHKHLENHILKRNENDIAVQVYQNSANECVRKAFH